MAHGPDNVPCHIVKEFKYQLPESITTIFNISLRSGIVLVVWKESNPSQKYSHLLMRVTSDLPCGQKKSAQKGFPVLYHYDIYNEIFFIHSHVQFL